MTPIPMVPETEDATDAGRVVPTGLSSGDQAPAGLGPSGFDPSRGKLGVDPILWEIKAQYAWSDQLAEDEPDWDQCTTFWSEAASRQEAISKGWDFHFGPNAPDYVVRPVSVVSCLPLRFVEAAQASRQEQQKEGGA